MKSDEIGAQVHNFARRHFFQTYGRMSIGSPSPDFILMLSHQRAGSTLLSKILCSNSEILGYGETHLPYVSSSDVLGASGKVLWVLRQWRKDNPGRQEAAKYFFDKALFNYYLPPERSEICMEKGVRVIFLVREPVGALPSIVRLSRDRDPARPKSQPKGACEYYVDRLKGLAQNAEYLQKSGGSYAFITYDQLLAATSDVFGQLQEFLCLETPLTEEYETITDRQGSGDPSAVLQSGSIDRTRVRESTIEIPASLIEQAETAYHAAVETLRVGATPAWSPAG